VADTPPPNLSLSPRPPELWSPRGAGPWAEQTWPHTPAAWRVRTWPMLHLVWV
jgi:hypothetical protein